MRFAAANTRGITKTQSRHGNPQGGTGWRAAAGAEAASHDAARPRVRVPPLRSPLPRHLPGHLDPLKQIACVVPRGRRGRHGARLRPRTRGRRASEEARGAERGKAVRRRGCAGAGWLPLSPSGAGATPALTLNAVIAFVAVIFRSAATAAAAAAALGSSVPATRGLGSLREARPRQTVHARGGAARGGAARGAPDALPAVRTR